jgi:hypothetical protein
MLRLRQINGNSNSSKQEHKIFPQDKVEAINNPEVRSIIYKVLKYCK